MAYNKKYAELGENVLDYVNEREDAIEQGFDEVDRDLSSISDASYFLGNAKTIPNGDCNMITKNGIYSIGTSVTNAPYQYGVLLHLNRDIASAAQIVFDVAQSRVSIRSARNQGGVRTWNSWVSL